MSASKDAPAILDANGLRHWLDNAKPGDRLVYHTGCLASDRMVEGVRPREPLAGLAKVALMLADQCKVYLMQHRLELGRAEYIAIAASPEKRRAENRIQSAA
jgi:hypothetical protein